MAATTSGRFTMRKPQSARKGDAHLRWAGALAGVLALAGPLTGCGRIGNLRVLVPSLSGMERVSADLWVEPGMPAATRADLQRDFLFARRRIELFYGPPHSSPWVLACCTAARARSLGLHGASAHTVGGKAILLGPHALTAPVLTHEWAHAELYWRLRARGLSLLRGVPRWFDEGLACVIGDEAKYSEAHWQQIERRQLPTPHLNELITLRQMSEAVAQYGDTRPDSAGNMHVVYTTAAHEVRGWLARAGRGGVLALVEAMNAGEPFGRAYLQLGGESDERP